MTAPTPASGRPSRSGARRGGDEYQDLVTLNEALAGLLFGDGMAELRLEADDAGSLDDLVVLSASPPHSYAQVKWAVDAREGVSTDYLTRRKTPKGTSILQKISASWNTLRQGGAPPAMRLLTNRNLDPNDDLLAHVDGRTGLLNPFARNASATSAAGKVLASWAAHVRSELPAVLDMLDHLQFKTGRDVDAERERAAALLTGYGFSADANAIALAAGRFGRAVVDGERVMPSARIEELLEGLGLRTAQPAAVLLVQAIDRAPNPQDATVAVDWVDLYDGETPFDRRQVHDDASWQRMDNELAGAVAALRSSGNERVLVTGALRQATFFLVGHKLAGVTGKTVATVQKGVPWPSDATPKAIPTADVNRVEIGAGDDVAVAFGVAIDPTEAVARYIRAAGIEVRELVVCLPPGGPHDQSVASPGDAVGWAQALRNQLRLELERTPAPRVHLFLAGPGGLALLLGHRWNRVAQTVLYEDLGAGRGYQPTFTVQS